MNSFQFVCSDQLAFRGLWHYAAASTRHLHFEATRGLHFEAASWIGDGINGFFTHTIPASAFVFGENFKEGGAFAVRHTVVFGLGAVLSAPCTVMIDCSRRRGRALVYSRHLRVSVLHLHKKQTLQAPSIEAHYYCMARCLPLLTATQELQLITLSMTNSYSKGTNEHTLSTSSTAELSNWIWALLLYTLIEQSFKFIQYLRIY